MKNLEKEQRIWVVPSNDLEAVAIIKLLEREGEKYFVTGQAWGASWEKLEDEIKEQILEAKEQQTNIYGVELQGNEHGVINVDHHIYGEDDRSNEKSSIEQVAEILDVELSVAELFVAANDKGYIPEMLVLAEKLGISKEQAEMIIRDVRLRDRKMQGVTKEQEEQAEEAIAKLGEIKEKRELIEINLPHSKTSTITDRLYGKYENLLVISEDGETNFYGKTQIINKLNSKFPGGWSGGQLEQGSGFWGGYANQEQISAVVNGCVQSTDGDGR